MDLGLVDLGIIHFNFFDVLIEILALVWGGAIRTICAVLDHMEILENNHERVSSDQAEKSLVTIRVVLDDSKALMIRVPKNLGDFFNFRILRQASRRSRHDSLGLEVAIEYRHFLN